MRYVRPAKETTVLVSAHAPAFGKWWYEHEECPLKKLLKPSFKTALFVCLQIVDDTITRPL